jgi:uncharacterized protein (DUF1697 family)
VALLRGLNVGGANRLPMAELVALFEAAGAAEVVTLQAAGNVLFRAPTGGAAGIGAAVQAALARRGLSTPVVLRTAAELAAVARANPYPDAEGLHVAFLAARPRAAAVAALDRDRSPPDRLEVVGREVYLRLPNGMAHTRITNAWLDGALGTVSTVRNWRTVLALADAARSG